MNEDIDYEAECSICLENFIDTNKGFCKIKCGHIIHALCLQDLLTYSYSESKQLCPVCRQPIDIIDLKPPAEETISEFCKIEEPKKQSESIIVHPISRQVRTNNYIHDQPHTLSNVWKRFKLFIQKYNVI